MDAKPEPVKQVAEKMIISAITPKTKRLAIFVLGSIGLTAVLGNSWGSLVAEDMRLIAIAIITAIAALVDGSK